MTPEQEEIKKLKYLLFRVREEFCPGFLNDIIASRNAILKEIDDILHDDCDGAPDGGHSQECINRGRA